MNNPYRTAGKFGVAWSDLGPDQLAGPGELEFGDYRSSAASPGFELQLESPSVPSGPGEQYVNTSTWTTNPLRSHGGAGANVLLRWNNVPMDARAIDLVVHFHGFIHGSNEQMLRTVAGYSGLNLSGRVRPTIGILPRGRLITPEEVRQNQARLNELARKTGKEPAKARSDVQTFPGLVSDAGAGLEALINGALQWFAQQRGGSAPLTIARLIVTAHSGGGGALDRLVASYARRRVCNPDEVHAFDALYSEAGGLKSWVTARLAVDRSRPSNQPDSLGGLRVFYRPSSRPNTGTQPWSERLGRSLPPASDPLSRLYRIDCSRLDHFEIPKQFGPPLLRDRATDLSSFGPCAGTGGTPRTQVQVRVPPKQVSTGSTQASGSSVSPVRASLPADVRAWIRSLDRSAIELVADETQRRRFLQQIDWSREYFPGNPDAQNRKAPGRLAEELFNAMARVTPERRVPRGVRFHDVTRVVASVPGQTDHKLLPEARDAFVRMRDAAASEGVQLQILSSWRSVARQQAARLRQTNPNAVAPGISAHNYGLAIDLNMRVPGLSLVNVSTRARDKMANMVRMYRSPIYKWLALNGSRFGWFPYKREPWHWEYNPPGLKERFEGAAAATREFEFENALRSEFEFAENESGVSGQNAPPNNRRSPDYVRWVQQALNRILGLQLVVDGDARVKTKSAIRSFQKQRGLFPDGIVGAKTEAALIAAGAGSPPSGSSTSTSPSTSRGKIISLSTQCASAALKAIPLLEPRIMSCLTVEVPSERIQWLLDYSRNEKGSNWVKQLTVDITRKIQNVTVTIELFRFIPVRPDDPRTVGELRRYMEAKGVLYYASFISELNLRRRIQTELKVSLEALYKQAGVLQTLPVDEYRRYVVFVYVTFPDSVKQYLRPVGNYILNKFDFDKSNLRDFHIPIIRTMAQDIVDSWWTSKKVIGIHLRGHTDDRGTDDYNHELGARRATAVKDQLKKVIEEIAPPAMLLALNKINVNVGSLGEDEPVSKTDRALNRRVEVIFDHTQQSKSGPLAIDQVISRSLRLLQNQLTLDKAAAQRLVCMLSKMRNPGVDDQYFTKEVVVDFDRTNKRPDPTEWSRMRYSLSNAGFFSPQTSDEKVLKNLEFLDAQMIDGIVKLRQLIEYYSGAPAIGALTTGKGLRAIDAWFHKQLGDENSIYGCYRNF